MRMRNIARAVAVCFTFGVGSTMAGPLSLDTTGVADLGDLIQGWQQRILDERLPVSDPQTWALRNMGRFSALSEERVELLRQATTIGEVEQLLNTTAPIGNGTSLGTLLSAKPANIAVQGQDGSFSLKGATGNDAPGTTPANYSELMFTALTPCRIYDSRVSQGGAGPWLAGVARLVKIGPYTSYDAAGANQGGSATSCGLDALGTSGDIAAVMVAVSTTSQTGNGYLNFYSYGATNPAPYGVVQYFRAGLGVQTSFLVMATDRIAPVWSQGTASNANAEVIIDVVGYFSKSRSDMWAVVNSDGTVARSYRTTSAAKLGTGAYEVVFAQDVTGCAYNLTPGLSATSGTPPVGGVSVTGRSANPNGIFVTTFNSSGTYTDSGFHVRVKCN
jgi:hypothetical protein